MKEVLESAGAGSDVRGDGVGGMALRTVLKRRPRVALDSGDRLRRREKAKKKNLRYPM